MMTRSFYGVLLLPLLLLLLVGEAEMQRRFAMKRATLLRPLVPIPTIFQHPRVPGPGFEVTDFAPRTESSINNRRITAGQMFNPMTNGLTVTNSGQQPRPTQPGSFSQARPMQPAQHLPNQVRPSQRPSSQVLPSQQPPSQVQPNQPSPSHVQPSQLPPSQVHPSQQLPSQVQPHAQPSPSQAQPNQQLPRPGRPQQGSAGQAPPAHSNSRRHHLCGVMPDPGTCRAAFPRYFYNDTTKQCDCFLYGGCGNEGLVSSYSTLNECHQTCFPENLEEGPVCKHVFRKQQTFFNTPPKPHPQAGTVGGVPFPDTDHISDPEILGYLEDTKTSEDYDERIERDFHFG